MSTSILGGEPTGQGWEQAGELAVAFVLSSAIRAGARDPAEGRGPAPADALAEPRTVEVVLTLTGRGDPNRLTEHLVATSGIVTVAYDHANDDEYS